MINIKDKNGKLLATAGNIREAHKDNPTIWCEDKTQPLQWALYYINLPTFFGPHIHKNRKRLPEYPTQELFFVFEGLVEATIYDLNKEVIDTIALAGGCFLCSYLGGHSFKVLEKDTRFIEIKTGPFTTVEEDKEKLPG